MKSVQIDAEQVIRMSYLTEGAVQSLSICYLPMAQVKKPTLLDSGRGRFMNSEKVTFIISMREDFLFLSLDN